MTVITGLTTTVRRLPRRSLIVSAVIMAVATSNAAVTGCASGLDPRLGSAKGFVDRRSGGGIDPSHNSEATALQETDITAAQAAGSALRTVPGTIESIELELEHGIPTWEVDLLTPRGAWHELEIDGVGGAVLANNIEIDGEDADEVAALKAARVTVTAAIAAAVKSASGTIFSAELGDTSGQRPTWKIQTLESNGARHQRTVDATAGAVITNSPQDGQGEN